MDGQDRGPRLGRDRIDGVLSLAADINVQARLTLTDAWVIFIGFAAAQAQGPTLPGSADGVPPALSNPRSHGARALVASYLTVARHPGGSEECN
ncbi:hypothetical protein SCLCIDRAFT_648584 [Scleroderma citrinum Foug A]|uniref:Uncharacterized protein n=1 Tax=Scleroderma citrinum Foug A TaxID=1036808 RepID=A0A0C3D5I5_9AGAM|nr:hypothetical protein SCLCIDRAFT_648584 [Scleroderma citrinum Foug A]